MKGLSGMDRLYGVGWRDRPDVMRAERRARDAYNNQRAMDRGVLYNAPAYCMAAINTHIERGLLVPARRVDCRFL